MKKFFIIPIFVVFIFFANSSSIYSYALALDADTTFYTSQPFFCNYATTIKNGAVYHVECDAKNLQKILKIIDKKRVKGESFCFSGSKTDINNLLKRFNAVVKSTEEFDDIFVVNAYNSKFGKSVFVGQDEINIQLAYHCGTITIGSPIILGSF